MVNDIIKGVVLGILTFVWYYVGVAVPMINNGAYEVVALGGSYYIPGLGYVFFTILAIFLVCCKKK